jgi:hypothetical protein
MEASLWRIYPWQTGEGGRAGVIITMDRKFLPYEDNWVYDE